MSNSINASGKYLNSINISVSSLSGTHAAEGSRPKVSDREIERTHYKQPHFNFRGRALHQKLLNMLRCRTDTQSSKKSGTSSIVAHLGERDGTQKIREPAIHALYRTREEFDMAISKLVREDATNEEIARGMCYGKGDLDKIDSAWHAYNSVKNIKTALVLGRLYQGEIIPSCDESFPCIDQKLIDNMGRTTSYSKVNKDGSTRNVYEVGGIMLFDQPKWSCVVNDAFILGAIHFGRDVYFASPRSKENIWIEEKQNVTVTGRELIGIDACKRYTMITLQDHENLIGDIARFSHSHKQPDFGFQEYLASIQEYLSKEELWTRLWSTPAVPI